MIYVCVHRLWREKCFKFGIFEPQLSARRKTFGFSSNPWKQVWHVHAVHMLMYVWMHKFTTYIRIHKLKFICSNFISEMFIGFDRGVSIIESAAISMLIFTVSVICKIS